MRIVETWESRLGPAATDAYVAQVKAANHVLLVMGPAVFTVPLMVLLNAPIVPIQIVTFSFLALIFAGRIHVGLKVLRTKKLALEHLGLPPQSSLPPMSLRSTARFDAWLAMQTLPIRGGETPTGER